VRHEESDARIPLRHDRRTHLCCHAGGTQFALKRVDLGVRGGLLL
jgi:hypothetical protein